jgi:hypothetical protein
MTRIPHGRTAVEPIMAPVGGTGTSLGVGVGVGVGVGAEAPYSYAPIEHAVPGTPGRPYPR